MDSTVVDDILVSEGKVQGVVTKEGKKFLLIKYYLLLQS